MSGARRVFPVYRNDAGHSAAAAFDPNRDISAILRFGRDWDVAFDLYDADTGELVQRGTTPREHLMYLTESEGSDAS